MSIINVKNQSHHTIYILRKDIRVGMVQKMTIFPYLVKKALRRGICGSKKPVYVIYKWFLAQKIKSYFRL